MKSFKTFLVEREDAFASDQPTRTETQHSELTFTHHPNDTANLSQNELHHIAVQRAIQHFTDPDEDWELSTKKDWGKHTTTLTNKNANPSGQKGVHEHKIEITTQHQEVVGKTSLVSHVKETKSRMWT